MVYCPSMLAHGLKRIVTRGRVSLEMNSKSLRVLKDSNNILSRKNQYAQSWQCFLKLRLVPPFFFTYLSNFISRWLLLQPWENCANKKPPIRLSFCEGPPSLIDSSTSGPGRVVVGNTCLYVVERQGQINKFDQSKKNKREAKSFGGLELFKKSERH